MARLVKRLSRKFVVLELRVRFPYLAQQQKMSFQAHFLLFNNVLYYYLLI